MPSSPPNPDKPALYIGLCSFPLVRNKAVMILDATAPAECKLWAACAWHKIAMLVLIQG